MSRLQPTSPGSPTTCTLDACSSCAPSEASSEQPMQDDHLTHEGASDYLRLAAGRPAGPARSATHVHASPVTRPPRSWAPFLTDFAAGAQLPWRKRSCASARLLARWAPSAGHARAAVQFCASSQRLASLAGPPYNQMAARMFSYLPWALGTKCTNTEEAPLGRCQAWQRPPGKANWATLQHLLAPSTHLQPAPGPTSEADLASSTVPPVQCTCPCSGAPGVTATATTVPMLRTRTLTVLSGATPRGWQPTAAWSPRPQLDPGRGRRLRVRGAGAARWSCARARGARRRAGAQKVSSARPYRARTLVKCWNIDIPRRDPPQGVGAVIITM